MLVEWCSLAVAGWLLVANYCLSFVVCCLLRCVLIDVLGLLIVMRYVLCVACSFSCVYCSL